jgi:hypothetical protein
MMNKKGNAMMNFALYQLPETSSSIRDLYFLKPSEIEAISDEYELVAIGQADSLSEVFSMGNGQPSGHRGGCMKSLQPRRSVSVGDIIHDLDTDCVHVVARYGFDRIVMKESV